jgi:high-affinity Fe2+/Pb2+ permease
MQIYRYGKAWHAIGVTIILLPLAFIALMLLNNERITVETIVIFGVVIVYILAFTKSLGSGMAVWLAVIAALLFIMFLQDRYRHGKGLPPAA